VLGARYFRDVPVAEQPLVQFEIPTKLASVAGRVSVSPNGKWLGYYDAAPDGHPALHLRDLQSTETRIVPDSTMFRSQNAFWSPDSSYVVFPTSNGQIKKVDTTGGTPQIVANGIFQSGTWGTDNVLLLGSASAATLRPLMRAEGELIFV
jgi:hypothetical protein